MESYHPEAMRKTIEPEILRHHQPEFPVKGTAVVSACLKVRMPFRMILSCDGQQGSGHAIIASVVIQSFFEVTRCFAASNGRTEARVESH